MVAAPEPGTPEATACQQVAFGDLHESEEARLTSLVRAHGDQLWRVLRRLGLTDADADDAFQEVLLVVARRLSTVEPASERSFLIGTAVRVAHRMLRLHRRRRRREVSDEMLQFEASRQPDPLALAEQRHMRQLLDGMLNKLPYELRSVFVLYEIEGFALREIAALLEAPMGTVASRLRRARQDFEAHVGRFEARQRTRGTS